MKIVTHQNFNNYVHTDFYVMSDPKPIITFNGNPPEMAMKLMIIIFILLKRFFSLTAKQICRKDNVCFMQVKISVVLNKIKKKGYLPVMYTSNVNESSLIKMQCSHFTDTNLHKIYQIYTQFYPSKSNFDTHIYMYTYTYICELL